MPEGVGVRAIAYVVGTRPNFVKTAPVVMAMRERLPGARHVLIHTEQHYDREMSEIFFEDLGLARPDHTLSVGSGTQGAQTARAIERIETVLAEERPDVVVVPGDVNSTLAAALAAVKLEIPVAHIEAGLRSFDRSMPEEINRLLVDQVSQWCFIHSPEAADNLRREGIGGDRIFFVGNTMIDTLVRMRQHVGRSTVLERLGLERGAYVLVTLHRPRLVEGPLFERTLEALGRLSERIPVVFPMHPRARARIPDDLPGRYRRLALVEPVGYVDFLALQVGAAGVVTDSGGVQEETTYLKVPCFTLRDNTERPITLTQGTNRLLGLDPETLDEVPELLDQMLIPLSPPAGWDGAAAERLAGVLAAHLAGEPLATAGALQEGW